MRRIAPISLVLTIALAACGTPDRPLPDGGVDGGPITGDSGPIVEDSGPGDDGGPIELDAGGDGGGIDVDGGPTDGGGIDVDGGPITGTSSPAPAAEVVRTGTGGFLLRGAAVIAPTGPIVPGEVLIVGNTIQCVAADCSSDPMAASVTVIDTHATIAPGLIDAHNHATYDFLPEWVPDPLRTFGNRYAWADDPMYEAHVRPEAVGGSAGSFICPATKWAELRSIVHATTTIMGQSPRQLCADRLARNADHYHGLGSVSTTQFQPYIGSVRDVADGPVTGTDRMELVSRFLDGTTRRYAVHMAEGVIGGGSYIDSEYRSYRGREPRTSTTRTYMIDLLAAPDGTPYRTSIFIHSLALTPAELDEAIADDAYVVWSPSSNILLYGATLDIDRLVTMGATVGLGPDWTVSGSDEVLSEMRFALAWADAEGASTITPAQLFRMATSANAEVLGLDSHIGRLAVGLRADIAVFGRVAVDPYAAVVDSRAADVRLTMIDGAAYYGDLALEAATAVNGMCEVLDACGTPKFLCAAGTPGSSSRADETVESIRTQLRDHLAAGWDHDSDPATPNQAYVVGPDDMQELVDCSL